MHDVNIHAVSLPDKRRPILVVCAWPECAAPQQFSTGSATLTPVKWMPEGRAVAYVDAATRSNLRAQTFDGKPPRQLTRFTDRRAITDFDWSSDGRRLAIARETLTNDIVLFKGPDGRK